MQLKVRKLQEATKCPDVKVRKGTSDKVRGQIVHQDKKKYKRKKKHKEEHGEADSSSSDSR